MGHRNSARSGSQSRIWRDIHSAGMTFSGDHASCKEKANRKLTSRSERILKNSMSVAEISNSGWEALESKPKNRPGSPTPHGLSGLVQSLGLAHVCLSSPWAFGIDARVSAAGGSKAFQSFDSCISRLKRPVLSASCATRGRRHTVFFLKRRSRAGLHKIECFALMAKARGGSMESCPETTPSPPPNSLAAPTLASTCSVSTAARGKASCS